jgi:hypothetical protein
MLLLLAPALVVHAQGVLWQEELGGTNYDLFTDVIITSDGGSVALGWTMSNDGDVTGYHANEDVWVVKLNTTGSIQWQKTLGGSGDDRGYELQQTADGGYILTGFTTSTDGDISFTHGTVDAWLVKLDSIGTLEWEKTLGGSLWDFGRSVCQTYDNGYFIGGYTQSNDGDVSGNHDTTGNTYDGWVIKTDSAGNIQWQRAFGGTGNSGDGFYSVQQTLDSGYVVAGYANSVDGDVLGYHGGVGADMWILKLDTSGAVQWQRALGGTGSGSGLYGDIAESIRQTSDGGYIIGGETDSFDGDVTGNNGGLYDCWIVKLDSAGAIQWQQALGGTSSEHGYSVHQTMDGGYIMAGNTFSNNGDVTSYHGSGDAWVLKLDSAGTIEWGRAMGGSGQEYAAVAKQTSAGDYVFAGYTNSNNGDASGFHGGMGSDAWIMTFTAPLTVNTDHLFPGTSACNVTPVPCTDKAIVQYKLCTPASVEISIFNNLGQRVLRLGSVYRSEGDQMHELPVDILKNGFYIVQIETKQERFFARLIKE